MSLTLSDALSQYRAVSDTTHKFWGYFQAVAAGTAGFAWSQGAPRDVQLFVFLSVAFTIFAILNLRLVVSSQAEAVAAANCAKKCASTLKDAIPNDLRPLIRHVNPDSALVVGLWHAGLSLATLGAVWWRYNILVE